MTETRIARELDTLAGEIDQLRATARNLGEEAAGIDQALALAWWRAEDAIRGITGVCSMGAHGAGYCGVCVEYERLRTHATLARL